MARFTVRYDPPDLPARFTVRHFRETMVRAIPAAFNPPRAMMQAVAPRGKTLQLSRLSLRTLNQGGRGVRVQIRSAAGYATLVDLGHRMVVGGRLARGGTLGQRLAERLGGRHTGRVVGFVPPHPFGVTVFQSQEQAVTDTLERALIASVAG